MNKNSHRVIFNASRGARMVVAETATSAGKGTRKASDPACGGGEVGLFSATLSTISLGVLLMGIGNSAFAQIVADPRAPGNQRATILLAPNGVPLVNIQTPSAAGVSRNTYTQFDIQNNGAILNNSRGNVQTQLGGWVQGNPWLGGGSARVILNEITSGNPTQIRGYLEVAGQRAEVVVANPAGIAVNGGGFINATRATLTTGVPQFNGQGGLDSFLVQGGKVSVDGAGLDARGADYAAILARAVEINAGVWAKDLKVVAGAAQVSADASQVTAAAPNAASAGSAPPAFALDVAALGGMYAGKIHLIGTEAGLGVRNAGNLSAAGELIVTAEGRLENKGTVEAQRLQLASASEIDNRGGTLRQTGSTGLNLTAPRLSNTQGGVIGAEPIPTPSGGDTGGSTGGGQNPGEGGGTGMGTGGTSDPGTGGTAGSADGSPPVYVPTGPGSLQAGSAILNDGGKIYAGGPIALQTPMVDNAGGSLNVATMALTGQSFSNAGGSLYVSQSFSANVGQFDNSAGTLRAGQLDITSSGDLLNTDGKLISDGDATLTVGGSFTNSGDTRAENPSGIVAAAGDLNLQAATLANSGNLRAGSNANVQVANTFTHSGSLTAGGNATVTAGRLQSTGALGAGIDAKGQLGTAGNLAVTTTGKLVAQGTNLAGANLTMQGASVDLSGTASQTHAQNIAITATQGDVATRDASVVTPGTLSVTGRTLDNDAGEINAGQLDLHLANLVNTNGAQLVQTGTGATDITLSGSLNNAGGTLASNGQDLNLRANAITNSGGAIEHAGKGTLGIAAASYEGIDGQITGNGTLAVRVSGNFNQDGSKSSTSAQRIDIEAGSLSNKGGTLVHVGTDLMRIVAVGALDNTGGTLAANGSANIAAGSLANQGGAIRIAGAVPGTGDLNLTVTGLLDNSAQGGIGVGGNADIRAGSLLNDTGRIIAVGDLGVNATGAIINTSKGTLAANGNTTLRAASLDNSGGTVAAVQGDLALTTTGATTNTGGNLQAGAGVVLVNGGLDNAQGKVIGNRVAIDSGSSALNNQRGTIAATTTVDVKSGALNNDAGLIQSGGAMTIDTHGQALTNTNAAGYTPSDTQGGITSADTLSLNTGAIDNSAGFIGAKKQINADTQGLINANGGTVLGQDKVSIDTHGGTYDNRGGQTLAVGDLSLTGNAIDNTGALIRSVATTTLNAGTVINANTLGEDQGIEGANVAITTSQLTNTQGAIRAVGDATVTSGGTVDNSGGWMSAGQTLAIVDPNAANPSAKTLVLTNTGGTLVGGSNAKRDEATGVVTAAAGGIRIDAKGFSADGTLSSANDLSLALTQDVVNNAKMEANGNLSYTTTGNFTNNSQLLAGETLTVAGNNVNNTATGEMTGTDTVIRAVNTLTNRGLIDSHGHTQIDAAFVQNIGTGRIYGDHISIKATDVLNDGGASIAARSDLDIGATTLTNRNGSQIFSGRDMSIGGDLDANRWATGDAVRIHNASAVIESLGSMSLAAATVANTNEHLDIQRVLVSTVGKSELVPDGWSQGGPYEDFVFLEDGRWIYQKAHPEKYNLRQKVTPAIVTQQGSCSGDAGGCTPDVTTTEPRNSPRFAQFGIVPPTQTPEPMAWTFGCSTWAPCPEYDAAKATWDASYDTALAQLVTAIDAYNAEVGEDNRLIAGGRAWTHYVYNETTSQDRVVSTDPARIVAGGNLDIRGQLVNRDSHVIAGGAITTDREPDQHETKGAQVTQISGTATHQRWEHHGGLNPHYSWYPEQRPYQVADVVDTIDLPTGWRYEQNLNEAKDRTPQGPHAAAVAAAAAALGQVNGGSRPGAIVEVPANVGQVIKTQGNDADAAQGANGTSQTTPVVVRSATPNTTVPSASLFGIRPNGGYLIETDPRFANYRNWLSSDYLLSQLGVDPANVQKRLGDGFYEQRLIREQVAQLTGYRYLEGFGSDEEQYTALMTQGATFAKQYGLTPGIALTPAQMAQLTSDIVWLVEQTVTLPDGSTQKALVPQVYVRVRPGDIDGSGALLSANTLKIGTRNEDGSSSGGDLVNSGTMAGRTLVQIDADNIRNLGGRISGGVVDLHANQDIDNLGGTIDAKRGLQLDAGRDINIRSTINTQTSAQGSRTNLDRVAAVYVTDPGAILNVSAKRDVNLDGAVIENRGKGGTTAIRAERDLNLGTVTTSNTEDLTWDARNYRRTQESTETGTRITTDGTTSLWAGNDLNARAANVDAGSGALVVHAEHDVNISAGRDKRDMQSANQHTSKGFLKKSTTTTSAETSSDHALTSSFSGDQVLITANNNLTAEGVQVNGKNGAGLVAGNVLDVHEARDVDSASSSYSKKTSGLFPTQPMKFGQTDSDGLTVTTDKAVASRISSSEGGVLLQGNGAALVRGAELSAAKDLTITGGVVSVTAAVNSTEVTSSHSSRTRGVTVEKFTYHDPGDGLNARKGTETTTQDTTLARTTLSGANVTVKSTGYGEDGAGGVLEMTGTTVNTPGKLSLSSTDKLTLDPQATVHATQTTEAGKDLMYQKARDQGSVDETSQYNQLNYGTLDIQAKQISVGMGAKDSIDTLAQQPGMAWVDQINRDPNLAGKIDWRKVEEAHEKWDYKQQGLTPEGATIITLIVSFVTFGAASTAGGMASSAVGGGTTGTVVGGAVTAGVTTLSSQAAVSLINNKGDLGKTLKDLGSSENARALATAVVTGGVLAGMNFNPQGLPTVGGGAEQFMNQLGKNLAAGAAKAVIGTAINGGSLEDALKEGFKGAILDTIAAQGAYAIGDLKLDAFSNKIAHAIAGCAVGAAKAGNSGGCAAGAIGAAIGEMAAEAYGFKDDTVQLASTLGGIAVAIAGGDAAEINLGAQAGGNAAANNYAAHNNPFKKVKEVVTKEKVRLEQQCGANCTQADLNSIDVRLVQIETVATLMEVSKRSALTPEQATRLGETLAVLWPVYGTPAALYQAITGESLTGRDLGAGERFIDGVIAAIPIGSAASRSVKGTLEDLRIASSVGGVAADGKMLMDFSKLSTTQKHIVGELLGAQTVKNVLPDAVRLGRMGEVGSKGIDDLYKVASPNADYLIVEYKFGTSPQGMTLDGLQVSDGWVLGTATGRTRVLDAVGNPKIADDVLSSFNKGRVEKWIVHTDPAGGTSIWIVDAAGKIAKADSAIVSKILGKK